ncbi:hypothetical protein [Lactobacillus crispatus]|uniref:Uncharacterized protein n=1 Tax=Lactobacillus crispatus TaxID=47770 RepID=A0A6A1Z5B5_9LACO|nr:hypothetical protein [Lactobacillus crispatus]KAA8788317.1 hypothetical protein F1B94_09115 [Lactobacillus crispatus]KAA8788323.1 hypothetical protein F1B98_09110 [Lactobacillus crispatus]KAB1972935.1 hypothetical protein F8251_07715 [Lactobacillus crispatus]
MENRNRRSKVENENVKVGVENKNEKKGLALSNSQSEYSDLRQNVKISIDRLTIVGDFSTELFKKLVRKWLTFSFIRSSGAGFEVLDYSNCRFDDFGNPHEEIPPGLLKRAVFSCRNNKLLVFFWALNLYFSGID